MYSYVINFYVFWGLTLRNRVDEDIKTPPGNNISGAKLVHIISTRWALSSLEPVTEIKLIQNGFKQFNMTVSNIMTYHINYLFFFYRKALTD